MTQPVLCSPWKIQSVLLHARDGRGHWGQPCPSPEPPVLRTEPGVGIGAAGGTRGEQLVTPPPLPAEHPLSGHGSPACRGPEALPRRFSRPGEPAPLQGRRYQGLHEAGERPALGILQDPGHRAPVPGCECGHGMCRAAPALVGGTEGGQSRPLPSFSPAFQAAKKGCRHFVCSSGNSIPSWGDAPLRNVGMSRGCSRA